MSIRRYLVLLIIAVITLVTFSAALQGYRNSMSQAELIFDNQLKLFATAISKLIHLTDEHTLALNLKPLPILANQQKLVAPDALASPSFAFQLWRLEKEGIPNLVAKSEVMPAKQIHPLSQEQKVNQPASLFNYANFSGQRWRTYGDIYQSHGDNERTINYWLVVAQPFSNRVLLAEDMILSAMTPLVLAIPVLAVIVFIVIGKGLAPLNTLKSALLAKKTHDLRPIELKQTPQEMVPVLDTLNNLLTSLDGALLREKRFASDAAHELRTPLSVLRITLHNLQNELGQSSSSVDELAIGVERMGHVVEQILMLNRINPEVYRKDFQLIESEHLIQQVIADLYPQMMAKSQDIEFIGNQQTFYGDQMSLTILLQNIISNAIKYSPNFGQIKLTSYCQDNFLVVCCDDNGPGIPESDLERVFDRFYRLEREEQSKIIGCGLGLPIVKYIADLHHGNVVLARSELGGLKVTVQLPLIQSNQISQGNT